MPPTLVGWPTMRTTSRGSGETCARGPTHVEDGAEHAHPDRPLSVDITTGRASSRSSRDATMDLSPLRRRLVAQDDGREAGVAHTDVRRGRLPLRLPVPGRLSRRRAGLHGYTARRDGACPG
jgi:hypothetical protein